MSLIPNAEIEALEAAIQRAFRTGDTSDLEVIGYGEITTVLKLRSGGRDFACKRLSPFPDADAAARAVACIRSYIERLARHGVDVIDTDLAHAPIGEGQVVVFCVQPALPPGSLGPDFIRGLEPEQAVSVVSRIFERMREAITSTVAPDSQLSNWGFVDDRLIYVDVSTPFLRDEQGNELFDFAQQTRALPAPIRWVVRRFLIDGILDNYHSLRGQALDFLGNLIKERLAHLIPPLLPVANAVFDLSSPIDEAEVRAHYKTDARVYAGIQAARRADRWWHQRVLGQPYPYLLPPPIDRGL